jgi:hypothetical protein
LVIVPVTAVIDQVPVDAPPPMVAPVKVYAEPEQMVLALPADTVAAGFTVKVTVLVTAPHGPEGSSVVRVSVTVPELEMMGVNITRAGEAVAPKRLSWLELVVIVPVAAVIDQVPVEAPPPIFAPVKVYPVPAQSVFVEPAVAVGAKFMVRTTVLVVKVQSPTGSLVVSVSVTVPLLVAMGVKVIDAGFATAAMLLS